MNSENISDLHRLILDLKDVIHLKRHDKCCFMKFILSAPTWNDIFEEPDGLLKIILCISLKNIKQ